MVRRDRFPPVPLWTASYRGKSVGRVGYQAEREMGRGSP